MAYAHDSEYLVVAFPPVTDSQLLVSQSDEKSPAHALTHTLANASP